MSSFDKQWRDVKLTDEQLNEWEVFLCENPCAGDMIQGTGGLRKLRWALSGKGKSGSIRTLYVDFAYFEQIYMIACFKKSEKQNLSKAEKKQVKAVIEQIKAHLRKMVPNNPK